jgi:hypothetical protein
MDGQQIAARIIREYEGTPNDMFVPRTRPRNVSTKSRNLNRSAVPLGRFMVGNLKEFTAFGPYGPLLLQCPL